jgi:amino acid transporter
MGLAIGIATVIYVAVAIGVFGTLPVHEVVASGATAIAVAAQPVLGNAGFWLMSVTALFATTGATNAGLYPAPGIGDHLSRTRQFPAFMGRRLGGRASVSLLIAAAGTILNIVLFDLSAIASLGSAVALLVFTMITAGHLRIRAKTGANVWILLAAVVTALVSLVTFVLTSLADEPASIAMLGVILLLSLVLDLVWGRGVTPVDGAAEAA